MSNSEIRNRFCFSCHLRNVFAFCFLAATLVTVLPERVDDSSMESNHDKALIRSIEDAIIIPEPIGDPLEPVNRSLWKLNQGVLRVAIQPSSKVYRYVVRPNVRRGIRNAGQNLTYPRNVVNNLLQQKWTGARDETYRFLLNSTAGLAGFFDVATPSGIPASEADFGQTFRDWGWRPKIYLMVPISGPSNERDVVGGLADRIVNPLTYFSPWSYLTLGFMYNNLTDTVDEYIRAGKAEFDPYTVLRYAWTIRRESLPTDITPAAEYDVPSLETLQAVLFRLRDPRFPERGERREVLLESTGRELPFTLWLQKTQAPLVYLVPGLGSHRLSGGSIAVAELLYDAGFSVISVSSTYNYEFMQRGATTPLPGYTPVDAENLLRALTQINQEVQANYPTRFTARALLGYSMGGFHSLYLAATERTNNSSASLQFDRFLAVDAPVRLDTAIERLDDHYRAALNWPAQERTARIYKTFREVAVLAGKLNSLNADSPIPLDANESRFLIGLAFRLTLRDIIFVSQSRTNQGVLKELLSNWDRNPIYREIMQYSFADYLEKFVTPYYAERGIDLTNSEQLARAVDLRAYLSGLEKNDKIRVIANANDILLNAEDLAWMKSTFGDRLTLFERGGHLGNLSETIVQREIIRGLSDLLPAHAQY